MSIKRLLLINPVNNARTGLTVNKSSRFPPIGLGIVAGATPPSWDIDIIDENWTSFTYKEADLVGITAFTASANRAYEIASIYRAKGVPVVMGGIHASMMPEEAVQFVDAVVVGEAESSWPQVLNDVERGQLRKMYRGQLVDPSNMAKPRNDLFSSEYKFASIQTSRGCPMDCDFCTVPEFSGHKYRRRPTEQVLSELEDSQQKMIFFVDDNIIGYGKTNRDEALALFKGMVERKIDKWWFCQASINFGDDLELLKWASRAGCKMVFLGLEANETTELKNVNKRLNISRGVLSYAKLFHRIHLAGIAVLGAFIFGFDSDTFDKLQQRANYMKHSAIDVMQTTLLTPLPGTRLFRRCQEEGRLLYTDYPNDWQRYDMTEVLHKPCGLDAKQLSLRMKKLNMQIYFMPLLIIKAILTFIRTRSLTSTMFAFSSNMNYRNVEHERAKRASY